ncbi:hypothetical protein PAXINDRAFT_99624 [Paxillus involutus ATCC 200175]|uniref:Uncharacterized protein n=1 Tax=Paxillus involutus ATCC 200175 TaxID=664439 RepID=A0A0C9THA9_PAXIN|nr:hypothetical protein PAXINDRAFT_99624 [Paxillus involutus ATCC 200175]
MAQHDITSVMQDVAAVRQDVAALQHDVNAIAPGITLARVVTVMQQAWERVSGVSLDAQALKRSLGDSELVLLLNNPVAIVWASDRPQRPKNKDLALDVDYSGETLNTTLQGVREEMAIGKCGRDGGHLLHEAAWLFNLRGTNIDFNPVFVYAVVEQDSAVLFIDEAQVDDAVKAHLGQEVLAKPYREILSYIRALIERGSMRKVQPVLLVDKANLAVVHMLGEENVAILHGYPFPAVP